MSRVDRVLVVVPAHDEEALLGRCLASIAAAAERLPERVVVRTVVVLDDCSDATADVAAEHGVATVGTRVRNVGAARALGVAVASRDAPDEAATWVATTDADSHVDRAWLADHLAAARAGHDALVGPVRPDPADVLPVVLREWHRRHQAPGRHVHGANVGVRLSAYRAVGGFPPVVTGEDVALVEALLAHGAPVARGGAPVLTSGRTDGRAPDGFAAYLGALALDLAVARVR